MATNFPGSLDSYVNPVGSDGLAAGAGGVSHANMHANLHDAVEALEAKVGADGSAVTSSHDYKIDQLESGKQDASTALTTTSTFAGDVSGTYNEIVVADNSHNHTVSNITSFTENVQDIVGGMVSGNTESGIAVTYQDSDGTLDFNVADPTISLTGDVTGSATMTNLGDVEISTTLGTVALGTDTSGNYVKTVSAGTGISVTGADAEGATKTVSVDSTVLRGKAGSGTYYPDANGYITITTGVTGIVAAFVQTTSQATTGEGAPEYVLTLPVTNINGQYVTCRVYEVNGSGNSDYTVSTIYDSNPPGIYIALSWLVLT